MSSHAIAGRLAIALTILKDTTIVGYVSHYNALPGFE